MVRHDVRRRGPWQAWLEADVLALTLCAFVFLSYFPFYPDLHSANELSRLYLAWALVDDHDVEITRYIREYGDINDKSKVALSFFSDKAPGVAFVSALAIAARRALGGRRDIVEDMAAARLAASIFPMLVLLALLRHEMRQAGIGQAARGMVVLAVGLGSPCLTYGMLLYDHGLAAVLVFSTTYLATRARGALSALVGFLAAAAVVVEYQAAVYVAPALAYRAWDSRLREVPLLALGGAPLLAMLMAYHSAAFGGPFTTGYSFAANPFFASVHAQGFMGVTIPRPGPLVRSLLYPSKGLFFLSPWCALGFLGLNQVRRAEGQSRFVLRLSGILLPMLFVACMVYWDGGWTVGQRHLTPAVPFMALPLGALLEGRGRLAWLGPGAVGTGILATGLSTLVFPHLPQYFANPFHDLVLPLLRRGCVAHNYLLAGPLSLGVLAVSVCLLLLWQTALLWGRPVFTAILSAAVLALCPASWFAAGTRLGRAEDVSQGQKMPFFVHQCEAARRLWDKP